MDAILLTESLSPDRRKYGFGNALPFSTMGSALLKFSRDKGYSFDARAIIGVARSVGARTVIIGTDADLTGTLVASVAKLELEKAGFRCLRHLYTAHGYVAFGGFMNNKQIAACAERARKDVEFSKRMRNAVRSNTVFGWSTAVRMKALLDAVDRGEITFKRASNGTNTVTYYTSGGRKGKLEALYRETRIAYPRVDTDYITDKPYQLYPHPPLDALGYRDAYLAPMPQEIPLAVRTAPLMLNTMRLMPPASYRRTEALVSRLFVDNEDGGIKVRNDRAAREIADYLRRELEEEEYEEYKKLLMQMYTMLPVVWISEDELNRVLDSGELPDFAEEMERKLAEVMEAEAVTASLRTSEFPPPELTWKNIPSAFSSTITASKSAVLLNSGSGSVKNDSDEARAEKCPPHCHRPRM